MALGEVEPGAKSPRWCFLVARLYRVEIHKSARRHRVGDEDIEQALSHSPTWVETAICAVATMVEHHIGIALGMQLIYRRLPFGHPNRFGRSCSDAVGELAGPLSGRMVLSCATS